MEEDGFDDECLAVVEAVRAFRAYLLGKEFILQTDHQALKWLLTRTNPEGRLWRWVYKLSEFSFSVEHRPGKGNLVADALSRVNAVSIGHEWSLEEIVTEQKQDPELASLRRELQKKNPKLGPYSPVIGSLSLDPASEMILCTAKTGWLFQLYSGYPSCRDSGCQNRFIASTTQ